MKNLLLKIIAPLVICFFLSVSPAKAGETESIVAHSADLTTTAIGLNQGLVEANPLGPLLIVAKIGIHSYIKDQPEHHQPRLWNFSSSLGWGAAANNICAIAGSGLGCLVFGAIVGYVRFEQAEQARVEKKYEEWRTICLQAKVHVPEMLCEMDKSKLPRY